MEWLLLMIRSLEQWLCLLDDRLEDVDTVNLGSNIPSTYNYLVHDVYIVVEMINTTHLHSRGHGAGRCRTAASRTSSLYV